MLKKYGNLVFLQKKIIEIKKAPTNGNLQGH